jgi:hypothetical protein
MKMLQTCDRPLRRGMVTRKKRERCDVGRTLERRVSGNDVSVSSKIGCCCGFSCAMMMG